MTRVIAYTALHYGREYLPYAIRSIIDSVDAYHVLYCPEGSHGHRVETPCPETRDELYALAESAAGDKLRWHDGNWTAEGQQRGAIELFAGDADVLVALDADEIWGDGLLSYILNSPTFNQMRWRRWSVPLIHYWRSFYRCVVDDRSQPIRIICPKIPDTNEFTFIEPIYPDGKRAVIHHFGYAQSPDIVAYKWLIHGHRPELRTDVNWFADVFMANRQTDCHPTNLDFWNPVVVDPFERGLPEFMREHPYAKVEVIE